MEKRQQHIHFNKEQKQWHFPLTAVLCYLLVAVVLTTGISFSRYTSTASGTDTAEIAQWSVSALPVAGNAETFELTSELDARWELTVTSSSEVTVEYDVVVHIPQALVGKVNCGLESNQQFTRTDTNDGQKYTFAKAGTIYHDDVDKTNTHTIIIMGTVFTEAIPAAEITVDVIARQVD